jgi:short-subunit dehydrogenase
MKEIITNTILKKGPVKYLSPKNILYLISGTTGDLGASYLRKLNNNNNNNNNNSENLPLPKFDLMNKSLCASFISNLNISKYDRIVFIHPVGKFMFEEKIDMVDTMSRDDIFKSNFETLDNILFPLLKKVNLNQNLTVVAFGSVSDKYDIPYWKSYTQSKNFLRNYLQTLSKEYENFSSVFVNVSTLNTRNENKLRPSPLNKEYWLSVEEVVVNSFEYILNPRSYIEIDIFKKFPNFTYDFYLNHEALFERWKKQMK